MKSEQRLQQTWLKSRWKTQENGSGAGQIRKDSEGHWGLICSHFSPHSKKRIQMDMFSSHFRVSYHQGDSGRDLCVKMCNTCTGKPQSKSSFMQNYPQLGRKKKIRENDELKTTSYTVNIHQIHKTRMPVRYALQEHAAGFSRHSCKTIFAQVLKKAGVVICHNFPTVFPTHKAYKCNWHAVSLGALKRWKEFAPIKTTKSQRNSRDILGVLTGISQTSFYTDFCCCGWNKGTVIPLGFARQIAPVPKK